jgi:prolyl-tRNA synthetase
VTTPDKKTIADVAAFLGVAASSTLKLLMVDGSAGGVVALVLCGDHELNTIKAQKLPGSPTRCGWHRGKPCSLRRLRAGISGRSASPALCTRDHAALAARRFRLRRQ